MIHSKNSNLRLWHFCVCMVAQSCPASCSSAECSLPSSSVHGIFPARIPSSSRAPSQLRAQTWVSCPTGRFFTVPWAVGEAPATLFKLIEYCIDLGKSLYILLSRHTIRNSHCCASHVCLVSSNYFMSLTFEKNSVIYLLTFSAFIFSLRNLVISVKIRWLARGPAPKGQAFPPSVWLLGGELRWVIFSRTQESSPWQKWSVGVRKVFIEASICRVLCVCPLLLLARLGHPFNTCLDAFCVRNLKYSCEGDKVPALMEFAFYTVIHGSDS